MLKPISFGYIAMAEGFDPSRHTIKMTSRYNCVFYATGVSTIEQACVAAQHMVDDGAQFIEVSASVGFEGAYAIIDYIKAKQIVPVGAVVFSALESTRTNQQTGDKKSWAFVFRLPGFSPDVHRAVLKCESATVTFVGTEMQKPDSVLSVVAQEVSRHDFIELCGGYGPRYVVACKRHLKNCYQIEDAIIGGEVKGNEFRQRMLDILAGKPKFMQMLQSIYELLANL
ncbi:hypothetical protein MP228_003242 [Amoeboaphelidium protococcarum]|nr:hypothetical protein MP228_003242 [Amoeboaphelidium protococcarum]